ncbi:hypothetical protein SEVIR_6G259900v4 [Setaria viridis]|uniref:DUF7794 domain-containing protein n=1 Tax=Setaria viridis TaxID=4556 RepID=A0A4U6UME1_SETVI|nr:uncharacterized protein LOC117862068 [Setaria viridis]TKW11857.1 hypothetical protein SEVIR_6G259900v2 [Setaria viridis]
MARCHHLLLLLLSLFLAVAAAAPGQGQGHHGEASAVFIDAASHRYLRDQPADDQEASMSLNEVSAAVSVLLGFAPPTALPALSSSQLNKVLLPNPFDRPRAVFLVQIAGSSASADSFVSEAGSIFKTRIEGANNAATGLTDKDELIIIHSDESLDHTGSDLTDSELSRLANWLEGSYQKSSGELVIPLESGNSLTLLLHKEADLEFASSLASLLKTIERAIQVHEDFSGVISPAELLVCHFTGIKALEDEYASTEIVKQGTEIVQRAVTKAFQSLHGAYKGKIVGLVVSTQEASSFLGSIIEAPSSLHISRQLEEASQTNAAASVFLVRKSLAWITGIILLVSTLIGVCLLMKMPLTRDTLLYSNVKID